MKRSEFIDQLAERFPHLTHRDVELAAKTLIDTMSHAMAQGRRVEVRGFGNFQLTARNAYLGRNPRTGASVEVPARHMLHYKPGKALLETLNHPPATTATPADGI